MILPTTFGKYFLTEKLATGGMGEIHLGKLLGPGGFEKQLVIKQIHPGLASRREFVELFVAEAKTMVSLSHGNIVPVYELGVVDGTYFIAMEYVDGPTLGELMNAARGTGKPLAPPYAAFIVAEILKGLDYAHRKGGGVVHRDLSPRNVIVSRDGEVKILDFGLAASLDAAARGERGGGSRPAGSFPYMSPEQAAREPLDARTDVFTVGILLWELLTGLTLFPRGEDDETLAAVHACEIPSPSSRVAGVPDALEAACLKALRRAREDRWESAAAFGAAVGKYLYGVETPVTSVVLSKLVAGLCPDVPRQPAPTLSGSDPATNAADGPATKPMSKATPVETFATNADFARVLEQTRPHVEETSAGRTSAAGASAAAMSADIKAVKEKPSSKARYVVATAILVGIAAGAIVVRSDRASRPETLAAPVPEAGAVAVAGADPRSRDPVPEVRTPPAPADARPDSITPDAGPAVPTRPDPPPPPQARGEGKLIVSAPSVPWANILVDGKPHGTTPRELTLPAGPHRVRVVCVPDVCPGGRSGDQRVTVKANETARLTFEFP